MLTRLPKYVLLRFLVEWCGEIEVCKLDSSICNKDSRISFLTAISSDSAHFDKFDSVFTLKYMEWLALRRLKIPALNGTLTPIPKHNVEHRFSVLSFFHASKKTDEIIESTELACLWKLLEINNLTQLELTNSFILTPTILMRIFPLCPSLQVINLKGCHQVNDNVIAHLAQSCPQLTDINLEECRFITDESITYLTQSAVAQNLTSLNLFNCYQLTDQALIAIGNHCSDLKFLDIGRNNSSWGGVQYEINNGVQIIATKCVLLEELKANNRHAITSETLQLFDSNSNLKMLRMRCDVKAESTTGKEKIVRNFTHYSIYTVHEAIRLTNTHSNLTHLDVNLVYETTPADIEQLSLQCYNLKTLKVYYCYYTDKIAIAFSSNCPQLSELTLGLCKTKLTTVAIDRIVEHCTNLTNFSYIPMSPVDMADGLAILYNQFGSQLKKLKFYYFNPIDSELIGSYCSQLIYLQIIISDNLTDNHVELIVSKSVLLEKIVLYRCKLLTDLAVYSIMKHCKHINALSFEECKHITTSVMDDVAYTYNKQLKLLGYAIGSGHSHNAEKLITSLVAKIVIPNCNVLAENCSNLVVLNITSLLLHHNAIVTLIDGCPCLKYLLISNNPELHDKSVVYIAKHCHNLMLLEIASNPNLTDKSLDIFHTECMSLCSLLIGSRGIHLWTEVILETPFSMYAIRNLREKRPYLEVSENQHLIFPIDAENY